MTGQAQHRNFDLFVGVDWSGAKGPYQAGLSVFAAPCDGTAPERVKPPAGQRWSRQMIIDYLLALAEDKRVLAGIDFAFSYPVTDLEGRISGFFPGYRHAPDTAPDLWAMIEDVNKDQLHLYGGGIWDHAQLAAYYNAPGGRKGKRFVSRRRLTEQVARSVKSPSPTFNCVGPAGVGTGSLAGMRALNHMSGLAHIWPFSKPETASRPLHLVEIFPSYYFAMAGIRPVNGQHGQADILNQALAHFASQPMPAGFRADGPDADQADAVIASAALRALSDDAGCWRAAEDASLEAARQEGWIFGVKSAMDEA